MKKILNTKVLVPVLSILILVGTVFAFYTRILPKPEAVMTEASGCDFFVAPAGSSSGDGSSNSPWDFKTALTGPANVQDGDTICVRGGTYAGRFVSKLTGSAGSPITVKAYPGERVTLDGYTTTTLTAQMDSMGGYQSGQMTVSDSSVFTLNEAMIAFIGGLQGEMVRLDNLVNGGTIAVVRGWGGSCGSNPCQTWPAGTEVRSGGNVLTVRGSYTNFIGFEVTISNQSSRVVGQNGGVDDASGIVDDCEGCKYINNVIHDVAGGFGSFGTGRNAEFYGNIAYNVGVLSADLDPSGHGFYIQNSDGNPVKLIKHNISFHNANFGYQSYADAGGLDNITYDSNVAFDNGVFGHQQSYQLLVGRDPSFSNNIIDNNEVYSGYGSGSLAPCYGGTTSTNGRVRNNYVVGSGAQGWSCPGLVEVTGNTALGAANLNWPVPAGNTSMTTLPTSGVRVVVHPNQYEAGRAHVIVYNWEQSDTVSISLASAGLANGQSYEIRDAQNFYGSPVASGTYNGGNVTLTMTGTDVPQLIGSSPKQPFHTSKQFGVFVVIPTSTGGTPTPNPPVINSFSANPASITSGQSSTLSWSVTGATSISINQNVGTVNGTSTSVSPTTTTDYTLTATNSDGSVTATATVTVSGAPQSQVAAPSFSPNGGTFTTSQSVTISSATTGTGIYYTTDGSTPTASSTLYSAAITLSSTTTLKAIAIKSGMTNSTVSSATFTKSSGGGGGGGGGGSTKPKPNKPRLSLNSNFTCPGNPTVYYYNGVEKEAYSELAVYQAWHGNDFSAVVSATAEECSAITYKGLTRLPEATLVKVSGNPTVYRIQGTTARPYATYDAFLRESAGKTIYTISIPYLHTYSLGLQIN